MCVCDWRRLRSYYLPSVSISSFSLTTLYVQTYIEFERTCFLNLNKDSEASEIEIESRMRERDMQRVV